MNKLEAKLKLEDVVVCPNIAELLDKDDLQKIGRDGHEQ